jgi:tetratricopeptide (TPR) repeat protein
MELSLTLQEGNQILVTCDDHPSHTFDLQTLLSSEQAFSPPLSDLIAYGTILAKDLFAPDSLASRALGAFPERIMLVTTDDALDAIPWEFTYIQDDFLVVQFPFVRGLPAEQRIAPPQLDRPLHIVAIPSNPLEQNLSPLNIDGEWIHLKEIIEELPFAIALERTRPPTIEQLRRLITNQSQRVVHFMGHGAQHNGEAILRFEQEHGELDLVTARQFVLHVRGTAFLVTLNACESASSGETTFSNLASALVRHKVPYALGMRFSIPDKDALTFSRQFYSELASGISVEEALLQARLMLAKRKDPWEVGMPVLYTALSAPSTGYPCITGKPTINEHQPSIEVHTLPRAEGTFQGRINELKHLGTLLTGDDRKRVVTIHSFGGQGKTALAREAVERFAFAWPGGVYATTLETLPGREVFVTDLARFLGIATQEIGDLGETKQQIDLAEIERRVLFHLGLRRMLLVLDNAETLIEAVREKEKAALSLAEFLQQLPSSLVSLLVTSRFPLGWVEETSYELGGLTPNEGADLFRQSASQKQETIEQAVAWDLSERLDGHPLSLRLLGSAFNESQKTLQEFLQECDEQLLRAENIYKSLDHRHRSLNACIEMSMHYLDANLAQLFSKLWLFHAPFLPETAVAIFDPENECSLIPDQLAGFWQRSLLTATLLEDTILYYRLLPTIRPYIEHYLAQDAERELLLVQFGAAYAQLMHHLYNLLNRGSITAFLAPLLREDLERAVCSVAEIDQGTYLLQWGWVLHRLGNPRRGRELTEQALEIVQERDQNLVLLALTHLGTMYQATGQPSLALQFYEQALPISREVGNRDSEATVLTSLGSVYQAIGQPNHTLQFYEQVLPIMRETENRSGEATILNNLAEVYRAIGQPSRALQFYEQSLPISREVGNRSIEATTLNNLAEAYRTIGQVNYALQFYEQALSIRGEIGDRSGEAATLNNLGLLYNALGQTSRALQFYEQALPISREVEDRSGEATILSNLAAVYDFIGQPNRALEFYEQALPIRREVEDRSGEATTLNNLGLLYQAIGEPKCALEFYEQALPIQREIEDHTGEAITLNNLAGVYDFIGQPNRALEFYEQALPIMREVGNRSGEAITLNNLAGVYRAISQPICALQFYEQALPIMREVRNRLGEATTFTNLGEVYRAIGQPNRALQFYEQALPISREIEDHAGEATTFTNLGVIYRTIGQPNLALQFYEQALPMSRETGDRAGEATTLSNLGSVYQAMNQFSRGLQFYEQALVIMGEIGDRSGETTTLNRLARLLTTTGCYDEALAVFKQSGALAQQILSVAEEAVALVGMAILLYDHLHCPPQEAISCMEQALAVLLRTGLSQDATRYTVDELRCDLTAMRQRRPLSNSTSRPATMSATELQLLESVANGGRQGQDPGLDTDTTDTRQP